MSTTDTIYRSQVSPPRERAANAIPPAVLLAAWLLMTFVGGAHPLRSWMLPAMGVAILGAVVAALRLYPRRPGSLMLGILIFFALFTGWLGLSASWAGSIEPVWRDTARAGLYLVTLGLVAVYLTDSRARRAFRYLLLIAATALLVGVSLRLWVMTPAGAAALFVDDRLAYPTGSPNSAAALFLVLFWPLLWMGADSHERAPVRGMALGTTSALLCLAVLTQSRGAFWALVATGILMLVWSPSRLRTLTFLLIPLGILVWAFPSLNDYWQAGAAGVGGALGDRLLLEAFLIAAGTGWVLAALEPWVQVSRRMRVVFGGIVAAGFLAVAVLGCVSFYQDVGDPGVWVRESWAQFRTDRVVSLSPIEDGAYAADPPAEPASRFTTLAAGGRWDAWVVAWDTFLSEPTKGVGAGNFVYTYDRMRTSGQEQAPNTAGLGPITPAETGTIGALLAVGGLALAAGGVLWPRYSAARQAVLLRRRRRRLQAREATQDAEPESEATPVPAGSTEDLEPGVEYMGGRWGLDPRVYAWETALLVGCAYWFLHGTVEPLWDSPVVTIPALLLLATAVTSIDARAGVMWPRWARFLPFLRAGLILMIPPMLHLSKRRASRTASRAELAARAADASLRAQAPPAPPSSLGVRDADAEDEDGGNRGDSHGDDNGAGDVESPATPEATHAAPFPGYRRADRHTSRRTRRRRQAARRSDYRRRLYPPGPLSVWFRRVAVAACLVLLPALALPWAADLLAHSAQGHSDTEGALRRAHLAGVVFPLSPAPLATEAEVYEKAAQAAGEGREGVGARLDALALALDARQRALSRDTASWSLHYAAGSAALELAEQTHLGARSLAGAGGGDPTPLAPGTGAGTPAVTPTQIGTATLMRALTISDLRFLAASHFEAALQRNPLSVEAAAALDSLDLRP